MGRLVLSVSMLERWLLLCAGRGCCIDHRLLGAFDRRLGDFPRCHRRVSCDIDNINVRGDGRCIEHIGLFLVCIRVSP